MVPRSRLWSTYRRRDSGFWPKMAGSVPVMSFWLLFVVVCRVCDHQGGDGLSGGDVFYGRPRRSRTPSPPSPKLSCPKTPYDAEVEVEQRRRDQPRRQATRDPISAKRQLGGRRRDLGN